MDYSVAREAIKGRLTEYVNSITQKSKGQYMYVCPLCGSGTGRNRTGAFSIDHKADFKRWKCFSCGKSGDIFDLIGEVEDIPDPLDQLKRAAEIYGIDLQKKEEKPRKEQHTDMNIHTSVDSYTDTDMIEYYKQCHNRLSETDYIKSRGISDSLSERFMLGYDPQYKAPASGGKRWEAIIIPTGKNSYVARNTDPLADGSNRYRKTGKTIPFNIKALRDSKTPIFVTEGEIDALSIMETGGEAIGLGSADNVDLFIKYVEKWKPQKPIIPAFDNDEVGQQWQRTLIEKLGGLGIQCYEPTDLYNGAKDANEALLKDPDAFTLSITTSIIHAEHINDDEQEAEKEEYLKNSAYNHLQEFINGIAESANTQAQPTGFKALDMVLDGGLYEGLYIIGAITSLGKTTLALQIADQIAASGRDVLIFSLEMARTELMSKSISRLTLLDVMGNKAVTIRDAKTSRGITAGARYENYSKSELDLIQRAIESYGEYAEHIFIFEGIGDIGVEAVRRIVRDHRTFTGKAPVVLIDYIQILAPYDIRATDKQNTDKAVLELKRISRDFKIPVIGISSFNRASYKEAVTLEAFKESGSLEYGSDVLIGLQLKGAGGRDFDSTEAKKKDPREIELVILKNRNGKTGNKIGYSYYPAFNYFTETQEVQ